MIFTSSFWEIYSNSFAGALAPPELSPPPVEGAVFVPDDELPADEPEPDEVLLDDDELEPVEGAVFVLPEDEEPELPEDDDEPVLPELELPELVLPVLLFSPSTFFDGAVEADGFGVDFDELDELELFVLREACEALQFDLGCVPSTKYAFSLGQVLVAIFPEYVQTCFSTTFEGCVSSFSGSDE